MAYQSPGLKSQEIDCQQHYHDPSKGTETQRENHTDGNMRRSHLMTGFNSEGRGRETHMQATYKSWKWILAQSLWKDLMPAETLLPKNIHFRFQNFKVKKLYCVTLLNLQHFLKATIGNVYNNSYSTSSDAQFNLEVQ